MRISRSHIEADYKCHFYRYLQYHFGGRGIVPKKGKLELESGNFAHSCLRDILEYAQKETKLPDAEFLRRVFKLQREAFLEALAAKEIPEDSGRTVALIEGLVRAWVKVRLPYLLENYDILDLEQEGIIPLTSDNVVEWMTRLDGVLRRKEDSEISALEFKTIGTNKAEVISSWHYDMQVLSHLVAIGDKFGGRGNSVLLEFLYKGYKGKDNTLYTPLLLGYRKLTDGLYGSSEVLDWRFEVLGEDGKTHRKGKEWTKFNVWEQRFQAQPDYMGTMEYWVDHALDMDALRSCLMNIEVLRNDDEMLEWFEQTQERELAVLEGLKEVEALKDNPSAQQRALYKYFPKSKGKECKCNKYSRECEYFPLCFRQVPFENYEELYVERTPHHEGEFEEGGE